MGFAWGVLTFVVALLVCGGMMVFAYSIAAEGLTGKKRVYVAVAALAAVGLGLMVQDAKARIDERITTLEFRVWHYEHGTATKGVDALKEK